MQKEGLSLETLSAPVNFRWTNPLSKNAAEKIACLLFMQCKSGLRKEVNEVMNELHNK
jgi:hypothetical protein